MFVNKNILKRLMKKTFKHGGLKVAHITDEFNQKEYIYIAGSYWELWCMPKFIPNEIKATLVELTGQIPKLDEAYTATKEGNQELLVSTINNFSKIAAESKSPYEITTLCQYQDDTLLNFLQDEHGGIIAINNVFKDMIITGIGEEQKENGEVRAAGPYASDSCLSVLWINNTGGFKAHAHYPKDYNGDVELWQHLEECNIPREILE